MKRAFLILLFSICTVLGVQGYEWTNLTPDHRLGGRMVSAGYLRGKVVVLDCRDYGKKDNFEIIRQLQKIWSSYKTKPFIVLGSHTGKANAERMAAILERLGVTYPVYSQATLAGLIPEGGADGIYVIDSTGRKCVYSGTDARAVSGVVGGAIFAARMPGTAKQWKFLLDYEIENLPGQGHVRLKDLFANEKVLAEMKEKFPEDAERYEQALAKNKEDDEIKKLAKLVELARLVKDRDATAAKSQKITKAVLEKQIEKFAELKESKNPFVVQEAKNSIAEMKFVQASLDK